MLGPTSLSRTNNGAKPIAVAPASTAAMDSRCVFKSVPVPMDAVRQKEHRARAISFSEQFEKRSGHRRDASFEGWLGQGPEEAGVQGRQGFAGAFAFRDTLGFDGAEP